MEVDRIMDYINEALIDDENSMPAGIRADTPFGLSQPDLHPWSVEDITDVHSLLCAEDPVPIPSVEEVAEENRTRAFSDMTSRRTDELWNENDMAARIRSLGWTQFHASGSDRPINCGPLPPLASLFGSTMKKIRDDFTAQKFETALRDENDEVVVIRFVAQPWPGADDSTIIGSPAITNSPSPPSNPPFSSLDYHLQHEYDDTPDSSTVHSPSASQELTSIDIEGDSSDAQVKQEHAFNERLEFEHSKSINLVLLALHGEADSESVPGAMGAFLPDPPSETQGPRLSSVPPQFTGTPLLTAENFVDDHTPVSRPPSSASWGTTSDVSRCDAIQKRKSSKSASRSRVASWRSEPNIKYFDPDPASGRFFRYELPHMDDSGSQEDDESEEIADCDIKFDPKGPSFICTCGQAFSRKNDVKRHFRLSSYHKAKRQNDGRRVGVKGVQCRHCGEVLSRPDARRRHEKVKACGKRAIRRPNGYVPVTERTT